MQLKRLLEREGYQVVAVAKDGRDSVGEVLRERPDIVLMDINLPNLDGIEATRRILCTYATYQPCVIMVTAYDDEDHRLRAMAVGASGYVVKPFEPKQLVSEILRSLEDRFDLDN
jgi:DNA-binding response OmpR family regulator